MNLTVEQVLMIAGLLDDSPGVDTARERFRRFLNTRLTDAASARALIDQCQQTAGEQHQRALQDAIVLAGRCLGFRPVFGRYHHNPGDAPVSGEWESRRRLHVILSVCAGQVTPVELRALADLVRHRAASHENERAPAPCIGLCVTTPLAAGTARVTEILNTRSHPELRLISVRGILHMADMIAAGRLTHDDVVRVLNPDVNLDSLVELVDHRATSGSPLVTASPAAAPAPAARIEAAAERRPASYWVAGIRLEPVSATPRFVEGSIARRRILCVNGGPEGAHPIQVGDFLCVFVHGVGVVAHARVADLVSGGSDQQVQVLRVDDVLVYHAPVMPEADLTSAIALGDAIAAATPLSREQFASLTHVAVPVA